MVTCRRSSSSLSGIPSVNLMFLILLTLHYITCNLADALNQRDLQLNRLSRRHITWSNVGLRALLKGPTAVRILSWLHLGANHRPCGFQTALSALAINILTKKISPEF